jgi:hypothetical protein
MQGIAIGVAVAEVSAVERGRLAGTDALQSTGDGRR